MLLHGIGYSNRISATTLSPHKKQEEKTKMPAGWGADSVSFSPEALAAYEAAKAAEAEKPAEQKTDPEADFLAYMDKSRSKAQSVNPEERLESLRAKLKEINAQIAQVASSSHIPEEAKGSRMKSLNSQASQIMTEIAELQAELAAEDSA